MTYLALADASERVAFGIGDSNGPVWRIDRECMWADWSQDGRMRKQAAEALFFGNLKQQTRNTADQTL